MDMPIDFSLMPIDFSLMPIVFSLMLWLLTSYSLIDIA